MSEQIRKRNTVVSIMRNIAVVICIGLLAAAPWTETSARQIVAGVGEPRALNGFLDLTRGKVSQIIEDVIRKAEKAIAAAEQKAVELDQKLKNDAADYQQTLDERDEKILIKVGTELDGIFDELGALDGSKCQALADNVRDTIIATIANQTRCVTEPLETGLGYIKNIYQLSSDIVNDLQDLRQEGRQCTQRSRKLEDTVKAIICLNKVGVKAVYVTAKRVPDITDNAVNLHSLVKSLRDTVPKCITESGASTVLDNVEDLINDVKECVKEIGTN